MQILFLKLNLLSVTNLCLGVRKPVGPWKFPHPLIRSLESLHYLSLTLGYSQQIGSKTNIGNKNNLFFMNLEFFLCRSSSAWIDSAFSHWNDSWCSSRTPQLQCPVFWANLPILPIGVRFRQPLSSQIVFTSFSGSFVLNAAGRNLISQFFS